MGRKPAHLGAKLVILAISALVLAVWVAHGWSCAFRALTGIPCITCGMSRAWLSVLRLDIFGAFTYHPMFWAVPVFVLLALFDGKLFSKESWNRWLFAGLLIGFFVCYLIRLVVFLRGGSQF